MKLQAELKTALQEPFITGLGRHFKKGHKPKRLRPALDDTTIDFSSNDYLGLSQHPAVKTAALQAIKNYGTGSTGARLLSGNCPLQSVLEQRLCAYLQTQSALIFNTGFQANSTIVPTLATAYEKPLFLVDRLCHASIYNGLKGLEFKRFRHNDIDHLKSLLATDRPVIVITEHLFSMDGDYAPIDQFIQLREQYKFLLYVDIAHSFGIESISSEVDIMVGTFGKALGSFGAFVAGSKAITDYLMNRCPGFIYTTALPPASLAASIAALNFCPKTIQHAGYFREALTAKGYNIGDSQSHIIPVITDQAAALEEKLQDNNIRCVALYPPTTTSPRLRFSVNDTHTKAQLDKVLAVL